MKLWIDDVRIAPFGAEWAWARSTHEAMLLITKAEFMENPFELIDIDHDAGEYAKMVAITSTCSIGWKKLVAIILFVFTV